MTQLDQPTPDAPDGTPVPDEQMMRLVAAEVSYRGMLKSIRSWGGTLIFLGILRLLGRNIIAGAWGLTLFVFALLSYVMPDAGMFIVYCVAMIWTGILYILETIAGLPVAMLGFAILQFVLAVSIARSYPRFRAAQTALLELKPEGSPEHTAARRADRLFPWLGVVLGVLSVLVFVLFATGSIGFALLGHVITSPVSQIGTGVINSLAVLGISLSAAALGSRRAERLPAIAGVIAGAIGLLCTIWLLTP